MAQSINKHDQQLQLIKQQYNSQAVISDAEAKLAESGINAAQNVYQSAILDWVDDVTMGMDTEEQEEGGGNGSGNSGHAELAPEAVTSSGDNNGRVVTKRDIIRGEIVELWLAYANLNRRANLFKSATEVYEQATNCAVAGPVGKIWMEYARFLEERGRPRTAQKIFLRALVGEGGSGPRVEDGAERDSLWNEFLRMMQNLRKNPNLSMEDLKRAVEQEHGAPSSFAGTIPFVAEDPAVGDKNKSDASKRTGDRPAKRSRWDQPGKAPETEKVSAINIDTAANVLVKASKNMPPEIEAAWHARDGGSLPSPPDPPLFTASPPKLGDPSGKDLLGNETALILLRMLTAKTHDGKSIGSALLELCQACWMMTALKEEEAVKAQDALEYSIATEADALESNLDARALVAGGALAAVQQANDHERNQFNMHCIAQREQLSAKLAWDYRKLLYTQQIILTSAKLPGFDGPTVDSSMISFQSNVCAVMHSAFYLRARVGEVSHVNMLNKQLETLEKVVATQVKVEPIEAQPHYPSHFSMQQMQFQQPMVPQFSQPPPMFNAPTQPPMSVPPPGFQPNVPIIFPPPPTTIPPPNMIPPPGQYNMVPPQQYISPSGPFPPRNKPR
mmetsp:Transcript_6641/g.13305  ORF Transcript_6641/g.13305 Transcript_6641/m.13305 type:complete len:617 (-) Transcript_6641:44-1894(-)